MIREIKIGYILRLAAFYDVTRAHTTQAKILVLNLKRKVI